MDTYPAAFEVQPTDQLDRWRVFQWVLAIPHLIIASAIDYVVRVVGIVAWFAILFTGRLPAGLANFICMSQRYTTRAYAYAAFLHDEYPPFDFTMSPTDPGGHPVRVDYAPELENRNRLTTFFRIIMAIPALLFVMVLAIVSLFCIIIGWFAVLFTGRWPEGLRSFVIKTMRVGVRVSAYMYLLTDRYPPFEMD